MTSVNIALVHPALTQEGIANSDKADGKSKLKMDFTNLP